MADEIVIKAVKRDAQGTGAARRLRGAGQIPAIVYGDTDPLALAVDAHDFGLMVQHHGQNFVSDLVVDDAKPIKVMPKELQHDPMSGNIIHVDFIAISMTKKIQVSLPVELIGDAAGVTAGGVLEQLVSDIEVECLPTDMVESIPVDVTELNIGDHLSAGNLAMPAGLTLLADPELAVASVAAPRVESAAEESEEGEVAEGEAGAEAAAGGEEETSEA
jgi:large subunit ribosomal protein L25